MVFDKRLQLFLVLTGIFLISLVVGDIISGKLMEVTLFGRPFVISVGMLPFPVTFVLTDVINEFYGKTAAKRITWVGFSMAIFAFVLLTLAVLLPWAGFTRDASWQGTTQPAFDNVFAGSRRILAASMCAYLIGQFTDIAVFGAIKRLTRNRFLWMRATGSTVLSQLIDTVVVQVIAWVGLLPMAKILDICVNSYAIKLIVAIGLTPVIYAAHALVERVMGLKAIKLDEQGQVIEEEPAPAPSQDLAA